MGAKILLADDSITIQKVVGIIFASEDYDLSIVDNGTAALAKARENKPDVLLLDAVMPGMTGYQVCEEIRRDPALQNTPILLLTGAFEPFDEDKARNSGADDFISKPFESQNLIDKVLCLIDLGKQRIAAQPAPQPVPCPSPPVNDFMFSEDYVASPAPPVNVPVPTVVPPEPAVRKTPGFAVEMVEGSPEDDLWGAFELEDVAEFEPAPADEDMFAVEEETFLTEVVEEDPFSFAEELETLAEPVPAVPAAPAVEDPFTLADDVFEIVPEETASAVETAHTQTGDAFVFEEDVFEVVPEESAGSLEPAQTAPFGQADDDAFAYEGGVFEVLTEEPLFEPAPAIPLPPADDAFAFDEELFGIVPEEQYCAAFAEEPAFAGYDILPEEAADIFSEEPSRLAEPPLPEEEMFGMAELQRQAAPAPAAAAAAAPAPVAGEVILSEQQLAAIVSRISREVIEKIAWEIVPDLAERIIREEIRKIKEGT